jgi:hypothetical protein
MRSRPLVSRLVGPSCPGCIDAEQEAVMKVLVADTTGVPVKRVPQPVVAAHAVVAVTCGALESANLPGAVREREALQ